MLKRENTMDEILEFFKNFDIDQKKFEHMSVYDLAEEIKKLKHVIIDDDTKKLPKKQELIQKTPPELLNKNKDENECQKLNGKENWISGSDTKPIDKIKVRKNQKKLNIGDDTRKLDDECRLNMRDIQKDSNENRRFQGENYEDNDFQDENCEDNDFQDENYEDNDFQDENYEDDDFQDFSSQNSKTETISNKQNTKVKTVEKCSQKKDASNGERSYNLKTKPCQHEKKKKTEDEIEKRQQLLNQKVKVSIF